jgi:hypothetical protein
MGRDKKNEKREYQHVRLEYREEDLPAWNAMGPWARLAYLRLKRALYVNGKFGNNNGSISVSPREMAKKLGCDRKTASAAMAELQAKGWIVCTRAWELGTEGKGRSANFRLTMFPTENKAATKEPQRWEAGRDYPVLVYETHLPRASRKKQNPGPVDGPVPVRSVGQSRTIGPQSGPAAGPVSPQKGGEPGPPTGPLLDYQWQGLAPVLERMPTIPTPQPTALPDREPKLRLFDAQDFVQLLARRRAA